MIDLDLADFSQELNTGRDCVLFVRFRTAHQTVTFRLVYSLHHLTLISSQKPTHMQESNQAVNITRYNTSKKLAQLNKVVQFLSFHLEERLFQIDYLRSSAERQQKRIFDDLQAKTSEIFSGIDTGKVELEESLKTLYQERLDQTRSDIQSKEEAIKTKIQKKQKEIQDEIAKGTKEIKKIMESLDAQFAFLNDKTKCDVSSINIRIIQMRKEHQVALKQFDFDAKKKLKQGDEESRKKLRELEAEYQAQIEQMKSDAKPDPNLKVNLTKSVTAQKKKLAEMKGRMKDLIKDINQQKTIFQQNMAGFRNRMALFLENATKEKTAEEAKVKKAKEEMEKKTKAFDKEKKELQEILKNRQQQHDNNVMALKNQMKMLKGTLKSELDKRKRAIAGLENANTGDLSAFEDELKAEMATLKAEHDMARKRYEELLSRLESEYANANTSEVENMEKEKLKLIDDNAGEVERYRSDCKRQLERENNEFEEKRAKLEADVKLSSSIATDFSKNIEEKKRLEEALESQNRAYESSMKLLDAQIEMQLRDQQREFDEIVDQLKQANNSAFDEKHAESQKSISDIEKEQDEEYETRSKEILQKYNDDIASINASYQDESELEQLKNGYEQSFKEFEAKLSEIVIPEGKSGIDDTSIMELRNRKQELPEQISEEKSKLISNWDKETDIEDNRHRERLQSLVYQQNEDEIPALRNKQKELAEELNNEIASLTTNLKDLQLIAPLCHYANDPVDEEQQRLKQEVDMLRDERKQRVKQALAFAEQTRNEYQAKIDQEAKAAEDALTAERDLELAGDNEMHNKFEVLRQERKDAAAKAQERCQRLQQIFDQKFDETDREFGKAVENKKQAIVHAQMKLDTDEKQLAFQAEQARIKLEAELMRLEGVLNEQLEQAKANPAKISQEIEERLADAQNRLQAAKSAYENRPMRDEELSVIERLENNLQLQTNHLATVGKDLIQYRQHLIQQEEAYNGRFGADPAVAVMRVKPQSRRPITTFAPKRLPKLYSVS